MPHKHMPQQLRQSSCAHVLRQNNPTAVPHNGQDAARKEKCTGLAPTSEVRVISQASRRKRRRGLCLGGPVYWHTPFAGTTDRYWH